MLDNITLNRFFDKVLIPIHRDECWIWNGGITRSGYGTFRYKGKDEQAHRISFEHFYNDYPKGYVIHHECRTTLCVNPLHLVKMDEWEHVYMHQIERFSNTCKRGHILQRVNTYVYAHRLRCKDCLRERKSL